MRDRSPRSLPYLVRRRFGTLVRPRVVISAPPPGIDVDWDVPVELSDGTVLRANVFRPAGAGPDDHFPVVLSAHPYGKDRIPARTRSGRTPNFQYRLFPQPEPVRFSAWTSWEAPDPAFWVPRGYVVVNCDLRGGGTAQGVGQLFSDQEADDLYQVVEWAGTRPWSNGRVGLLGVSYLAISQYKVAALRPPHLAAICPWEGFSDLYRDFARPGGILENGFSVIWSTMTSREARVEGNLRRDLVTRPTRDAWYESVTPRLEEIDVPTLVCASFSDHNLHSRGSFEVFRRIGSGRRWLYTHRDGKWSHFYGEDAKAAQAGFFDHVLRGDANGWDARPPVRLAVHEAGPKPVEVSLEQAWPPPDLALTTLHLDARVDGARGGVLLATPPDSAGTVRLDLRGRAASFGWTVSQDVDVIGPAALRLFVQAGTCLDPSLFVAVRKVRDGREVTFEGSFGFNGATPTVGWHRVAFRELDEALSSPLQPVHTFRQAQPLGADEIVSVDVPLLPQATRWRAGEELRLEIGGRWVQPRNPVTGQLPSGYARSPRGTVVLHTGGAHAAALLLGTRPVAAAAAR